MNYETAEEFITEFRRRVGDSTCEIPVNNILSWLNTALRRLARSRGLDKLFTYHDTFELARLNEDGTPAASWRLQGLDDNDAKLGMIIDIKSILVVDSSDCGMDKVCLCYMPFNWFRKEHPFPENECAGVPCAFTISQIKNTTTITFDKPIPRPFSLDLVYTAFPPRVQALTDLVYVPLPYIDIVEELVMILYNQEAQDYAFARSSWEDVDFFIAEARELLAKQPEGATPRCLRGSF